MKQMNVFLFLSLTVLGACKQKETTGHKPIADVIPVRVMQLQQNGVSHIMNVSGAFTTDDEVFLSFKTGGLIDRILVKDGDAVRAGQLMATLKLTEIDAQVQQATLGYEKAQRDYARADRLYADSVATLEQLQNAKTAMDVAAQQLEAAKFNRSYSEIRAPKDGYVLHKMVNEGQLVGPGVPVFQTNGARSGNWLLRVGLSDRQWAAIKEGDKAVITTDNSDKTGFSGTVVRRSQGTDPATGSLTADIKPDGGVPAGIASGMFGKAAIAVTIPHQGNSGSLWSVPYDALLDADGSTGYVFVVNDNNTVTKMKITIQGMEKNNVLVSDGLQTAKAIVISGSAYLTDSSKISIIQ